MAEVLSVVMRWLHLASVVTLIGGVLYGWRVFEPGSELLPPDLREAVDRRAAARFRPLVYSAVVALAISGIYNIYITPGHTARYLILLAIKLRLVLHVFAVAILIVRDEAPRRARLMAGAAISGLIIILISAYLRRIF